MKGREKRIARARERMLDALVCGGADPEALEIIQWPAPRVRWWDRLAGRDVELIAQVKA